jgi:hypothetical protein
MRVRSRVISASWALVLGCSDAASDAGAEVADEGTDTSSADEAADTGSPDADYPCLAAGDGKTTAVFVNGCAATLEVRGSDIADASVAAGEFACRDLGGVDTDISSKRYWGFLGADPGPEHHTLAEFTFNTDFNDFDWYNISHVDAHNLTMSIVPLERDDCDTLTCADTALLAECPEVGRLTGADDELIACVSPERDNPDSPVALFFEACDDAYAWSGDDQQGEDPSPVRACAGEDYAIVFCP